MMATDKKCLPLNNHNARLAIKNQEFNLIYFVFDIRDEFSIEDLSPSPSLCYKYFIYKVV